MKKIQLDMFEVQLGAAVLLQFRTEKSIIRVLADAGVHASGYPIDHVHKKLVPAINDFSDSKDGARLDLIIGTHYDADHLEGLVPIINDNSIDIGEAWMPPVANDTEITSNDDATQVHQLLAYQFSQEDADKRLVRYLESKKGECEEIRKLQRYADKFLTDEQSFAGINDVEDNKRPYDNQDIDSIKKYFTEHINETNSRIGNIDCTHADCDFHDWTVPLTNREIPRYAPFSKKWFYSSRIRQAFFSDVWSIDKDYIKFDIIGLAYIQRAAATDAINAASLYKVVQALKKRGIPIFSHSIPDGKSRRFIWDESNKRFIPRTHLTSDEPELLLMGPSEGLIKKHQKRLPIGEYMMLAYRSIPIKNITPSNQLSYVVRFGYMNQGILITGDAGFVDFKPDGKDSYHKDLINKLTPLHLIQVAHHGGNNAHFYRVLLESSYPKQTENSFLLLSHATDDKHRPSKEFGYFIEDLLKDGDDIKLLFTSQPLLNKVVDFKGIIHPPTFNQPEKVGDIQVIFDGQKWNVLKHAIKV